MHIGFLVSGNKYTGAAAVAEHMTRAVMAAGAQAELLYVAGNNLEERLGVVPWAIPGLRKERGLSDVRNNLRAVRELAERSDAVVCHLPHDHFLSVAAGVHHRRKLIRNLRNARHLRRDPYHKRLLRQAEALLLANHGLARHLSGVWTSPPPWIAPPVPLEDRFTPAGDRLAWRRALEIPLDSPVLGMIGKVAPGRGFDTLVETAARIEPPVHVLIVGHGEAQPHITSLAESRGLADRLHWAGYREKELPDLYAAMDVVLFPAPGSDHGHRAVSEAQGCARPVVAAAIPGVEDLIEDQRTGRIVPPSPDELAAAVSRLIRQPGRAADMGRSGAEAVARRRFRPSGELLLAFLRELGSRPSRR